MNSHLTFQTVAFSVIDHKGQTWLTMRDITAALYSDPEGGDTSVTPDAERAVRRVFSRHASEFTADMTALVKVPSHSPRSGVHAQRRAVRIFSLRGAYLLGMLVRTPKAEAFRRWVLDVLEGVTRAPADLHARLIEAEQAEAQSFAVASLASRAMNQRRREKPRLLERIQTLRESVQLALPMEMDGGAA